MFVWNHFTNDARVMREGLTLSEGGYDVDLIAIDDPKDDKVLKFETINDKFRVHRVRMYPWLLEVYQNNKKAFIISIAGVTTVVSPVLFYKSWVLLSSYFMLLAAAFLGIKNNTLRKNMIKLARSIKMIGKGYVQNADIYHSNDLNTLTQGVICAKLRLKKRKLVYDSHEVQTDRTGYDPRIIKIWEKSLLPFVDITIVENHTRAAKHAELYGDYPVPVHNYSDLYDIKDRKDIDIHGKLGISKDEKILLYQGGIQEGRGLEQLVQMMPKVKAGTLLFIGDGKLKPKLEQMVEEQELQTRVKFLSKVPLAELPSFTKAAYLGFQVLQNTSFNHYSASSNKLFEYIMAHVPVVGCDFPEIKKVIDSESVGLSVDAASTDSIAHAVNTLVEDEEQRDRYSQNCEIAKHKYNWDAEKETFLSVYSKLDNSESKRGVRIGLQG